jgi:hypothetical protein
LEDSDLFFILDGELTAGLDMLHVLVPINLDLFVEL